MDPESPHFNGMNRAQRIEEILRRSLTPSYLEVIDESHRHAGHAGSRPEGETHFRIVLVCPQFEGMGRIQRHRTVHDLLAFEQKSGLHALSLELAAPSEVKE